MSLDMAVRKKPHISRPLPLVKKGMGKETEKEKGKEKGKERGKRKVMEDEIDAKAFRESVLKLNDYERKKCGGASQLREWLESLILRRKENVGILDRNACSSWETFLKEKISTIPRGKAPSLSCIRLQLLCACKREPRLPPTAAQGCLAQVAVWLSYPRCPPTITDTRMVPAIKLHFGGCGRSRDSVQNS
ncbi:hypothetical protein V5O48_010045 [Marasmius crinis-equi]|uniref:Uncharacterized protein n=1 Tax=Marasmius crinis-equi TaxID=585013 RepID=A0ABR3F9Y1_9AGAR